MSRLEQVFARGAFAVTAEVGPPKSADRDHVLKAAARIRGYVDAANVTDNQTAIVRMSSLAGALLTRESGVEPVMQMTCRDRNRIALQSDLLGAWALGIRNILCLSGDHQRFGDDKGAKNVYDIDSIQLIGAVQGMNAGHFLSGRPIQAPPQFFIGATANPFADPEELQLIRLEKKIQAGARFIQTQAVYDLERFSRWMERVRVLGLHERAYIQAGVLVNRSARSIEMTAKVPGMRIPEPLIRRMQQAEEAQTEGIALALELIGQVKQVPGVSGVHIMAVSWETAVPEVIARAGFLPRPAIKKEEFEEGNRTDAREIGY